VVTAPAQAPIADIARAMQERAVGSVVLLGADERATGLLTDRDVALRVVAAGLDPAKTAASAVMSQPVKGARPDEPLEAVVARMRTAGVRRIPILQDGRPVGIVSFDDLLVAFGRELEQLAECVSGEIRRARARSYPERVRHDLEEVTSRLRAAGDHTWRTLGRELDQLVERVGHALLGTSVARAGARANHASRGCGSAIS
jgi:signal-transduction protein with cAMP-binding, CBS, and nucleotidyltransferase domain